MKTRVILLTLLLVAFGARAGDVSLPSQTARQEIRLYESDGARKTSGAARCYMDGADSSDTEYQIDLTRTIAGADTFWTSADTTVSGDQYRDVRVDIYSTDGSDSLLLDNYLLHGRWVGKHAVDATAIATDAIDGSKVIDRTLQAADADTGAWTSNEIEDGSLTGDDISTGANLDVNSATIGDTLHVAGAATFEDSLKSYGGIYVWTGTALVLIPWTLIPTDTPSTNDVLEFDGTRAQWDDGLAPNTVSATTSLGAPKLSITGTSAGDTTYFRNGLHSWKALIAGGGGTKGALKLLRHGYTQTIMAGTLEAGDGDAVLALPYTLGAAGDLLQIESAAGDTTKTGWTTPKKSWNGMLTWTSDGTTQDFIVSGMTAPIQTYAYPAHMWSIDKISTGRWYWCYASSDTLFCTISTAYSTDHPVYYSVEEP